jgi:hypothetical protein
MGKWNFNVMNIFGLFMVVVYMALGLYILFAKTFRANYNIPSEMRIVFGSLLIIYGIYRFVRIYFKLKNPES